MSRAKGDRRRSRLLWAGRLVSGIPAAFLIFDAVIKLDPITPVAAAFERLGVPLDLAPAIGVVELACLLLYLVPRTSVVGALLLTGFLGGAVAIHVRVGDPLLSHVLFPSYVGLLLWAGLLLRDGRLRVMVGLVLGPRRRAQLAGVAELGA